MNRHRGWNSTCKIRCKGLGQYCVHTYSVILSCNEEGLSGQLQACLPNCQPSSKCVACFRCQLSTVVHPAYSVSSEPNMQQRRQLQ